MSLSIVHAQQPNTAAKPAEKKETPAPAAAASITKDATAIMNEFSRKTIAIQKQIRFAPNKSTALKLRKQLPRREKYAAQLLQLVKPNPKAEGAQHALAWVTRGGSIYQARKAADLLLTYYPDSPNLIVYVNSLLRSYHDDRPTLRKIAILSGDKHVRIMANFALAAQTARRAAMTDLTPEEKVALNKEAIQIFTSIKNLPNIRESHPRLLSKIAKSIYKLQYLSIGCTAPDIVGKDHEGKEFKLSDYRGKVVLLDFWGYW